MARVSVGLPVYNGERYLNEALDSILCQTFEDFELIISDNASSDRTEEMCREYAKNDKRIRYSRSSENLGAAWNFNRVAGLSTSEYFRWATADDLSAPEQIQTCVEVLDRERDAVLCYPKTVLIDENGEFIRYYEDNLDLRSPSPRERLHQFLMRVGLCNVQYGLMRSDRPQKDTTLAKPSEVGCRFAWGALVVWHIRRDTPTPFLSPTSPASLE